MNVYLVMKTAIVNTPEGGRRDKTVESVWSTEEKAHGRLEALRDGYVSQGQPYICIDDSFPGILLIQQEVGRSISYDIEKKTVDASCG